MHCLFGLIIFLWISINFQILFDTDLLRPQRLYMFLMPSYLQLSFQLPPITSVLALLFIHIFSPFFLLCTYVSVTSLQHPHCCLSMWLSFLPLFFCFCFPPSFLVTSLFVSPLLTFPQSLVLPRHPTSSQSLPLLCRQPLPADVARYCGCEERCSDSEMCHSAES